jgi:amino acid adenylation domain-containing protein
MSRRLLHEYLLRHAESTPGATAVVDGRHAWSFAELAARAARAADRLAAAGVGCGDRVVLALHPSAPAIAVELGCGVLGAAFVPVSPEAPPGRLRSIVEVSRPALVVTENRASADAWGGVDGAFLEKDDVEVPHAAGRSPAPKPLPTDAAYLIFTSGSTGTPKGIVMSHGAAVTALESAAGIGIPRSTRLASLSPLQFDFSIIDMGLSLGCGATLVLVPRLLVLQPARCLDYLIEQRVTQIDCVPTVWRQLARLAGWATRLSKLHTFLYGGEGFSPAEIDILQRELPQTRIVQAFGHSESILCSFAVLDRPVATERGRVTIGNAIDAMEMFILDDEGRSVDEPGAVGELWIRGAALFSGYWEAPEATAARLVADPRHPTEGGRAFRTGDLVFRDREGRLYFFGRKDAQIKIAGNRLELEEVEAVLEGEPGVERAVAAAATIDGRTEVIAFLVAPHLTREGARTLRQRCGERLPHYAVPRRIVLVPDLPSTLNGKADRRRLLEHYVGEAREGSS